MEIDQSTGQPYGGGIAAALGGLFGPPAPSTPDAGQSQQNGGNGTSANNDSNSTTSGGADPAGENNGHVSNPIILDLSGSGINITQLSQSNVFMDSSGSGYKSQTAWAGVGNGVLFYDPSGQGVLTQANQYIFTDWDPSATTDLQALEDVFDTNHDGELDTNDSNYGDFFVMETNADGTETAHSLTSLNITSIDLNANSYQSTLPDGSGINGETTYTVTTTTGVSNKNSSPTTTTTQYTAASVTLATSADGYAVSSTTTQNADGTTTIDNIAKNGDGSVAYSRILNTAVTGGTTTKTLADLNGGGVVTSIETDTTTTPATNTTVETVVNYRGGSINAAGEIVTSGERLNATTTTTSGLDGLYSYGNEVTSITRDQTGGGWTSQTEVDTFDEAGQAGNSSTVITDLNEDGSTNLLTTTTITNNGLNRTTTTAIDGNANWSTTTAQVTTTSPLLNSPTTDTVTNSVGTTTVSQSVVVTEAPIGDAATRTTTLSETDGASTTLAVRETSTETTALVSNGSITTITDSNGDGSFKDESVTTVSTSGLLKTTEMDSTGAGTASAPVFDATTTDNTVVNSDGSRTETVTDTSANGQWQDQTITYRGTDGISRTVSTDSTGDGLFDQIETITNSNGVTDMTADINPNGSLASETVVSTSADGLTKVTSTDSTGQGTQAAPVFDTVTTDKTTHNSDGSSLEDIVVANANGSWRDHETIYTSSDGLATVTTDDYTGAGGVPDGNADRVTTDTTTINSDGSLTETDVTVDQYGNQLSSVTTATSANRLQQTITTQLGGTWLAHTVETITTAGNGTKVDQTVDYDANGDVDSATSVSTTADGLTKITSVDTSGQTFGTAISYDRVTTDTTVINNDGSRTETAITASQNGNWLSHEVSTTSANGLLVTTSDDPNIEGWFDTVTTDTTVLNQNGSTTETVTDANETGSWRDQTITTTSANGLSITTQQDYDGSGKIDLTTTDVTTINANGSRTEIVTDTNMNGLVDLTTTTSGQLSSTGKFTTIQQQSFGSVATYSIETISTLSDGTKADMTQYYAAPVTPELYATETTVSANGLVKGTYEDINGDGHYDIATIDATVINADGSTTETVTKSNASGVINETQTITSANGMQVTTKVDDNGAMSNGNAVFDLTTTDSTVLNSNGGETETVTEAGSSGTIFEETTTTTSADKQTQIINHYLDETGSIGTIDQNGTIQTESNGSVVDTIVSHGPTYAVLSTVTKTTSGNGLVKTTTYANGAGTTIDRQTDTTTLNADGSEQEVFTDVGATDTTVTTETDFHRLSVSTTTVLSGAGISETISTSDVKTLSKDGWTSETITDTLSGRVSESDTTTKTVSADGRVTGVSTSENGDGKTDITDYTTLNLDGSKVETIQYNVTGTSTNADTTTINTSSDGRTVQTTSQSDYDGSHYNDTTELTVANANNTTTDTFTATGSFGAGADSRVSTTTPNIDGSTTTTTETSNNATANGDLIAQNVAIVSASGLVTSFAFDTTGFEYLGTLQAAAADLISGSALPTALLTTDILGSDTTVTNADGSTTEVSKTFLGTGTLRSQTTTVTSGNGLVTTTSIDNDGNGVAEQVDTETLGPDGSKIDIYDYYGDTTATANMLIGSNTVTTSANGLVTTLTTSTGITDTTTEFAGANGSYLWARTVTAGSAAASSSTIFNNSAGSSSHMIDANGIDTWTWTNNAGTSTITIDVATEAQDEAIANSIFQALTGEPMDDSFAQYLGQYITNGVLNRQAFALSIVNSQEFAVTSGGAPTQYNGSSAGYLVNEIVSVFQNLLGRAPSAAEVSTYFNEYAGTPGAAGIAAMAVAVAQYATDLGATNLRTQLDQDQDLVTTIDDAMTTTLPLVQVQASGTYAQSNAILLDQSTGSSNAATINGSNDFVVVTANSVPLVVNGNSDEVSDLGSTAVTLTGSHDSISVSGATVTISGSSANLDTIDGNNDTINVATGDIIGISGAGDTANVSGTYLYVYGGASANVSGSNDSINVASGATLGIYGNNDIAYVAGATIYLNSGDTNDNVSGNSSTINAASGLTFGIYGSNDTANESSGTVYINSGDTGVNVVGNNNTISAASGVVFGVYGSGNTAKVSGATAYLNSGSSNSNISGNNDTIYVSAGDSFGIYGSTDTAYVSGGTAYINAGDQNDNVSGNNEVIDVASGVTFGAYGAGNSINMSGGTAYLNTGFYGTVFGSNDVLNVGSGAVFGISGSSDTAYATGATAYVNTGSTNDTITGNSNNINVASGLTFAINGSYDTVNTGNATLSISNNLVGVTIYANNSTITEGNNDTVDVIGSGDTIIQGTGDTNLGVGGSNSTNGGGQDFVSNAASLATFSQALNVVAQDDLNSSGDSNAAATAQTSAFQAAVTAQMAADFGAILSPEYEGAAWAPTASTTTPSTTDLSTTGTASSSTVVTWSFANSPGTANDPFSSYIGAQYQATIEAAINAWSAVSGLTFVEVPDSATTDVRIGWGDFQTATSGVIGYTDFQQTNGAIQQGASVRLEDPMETSLTTDPAGSLVYSGTNTTLYQVALHEIGRAIGLSDNADPNSVMFSTASSSNQTLDQTDIDGAQALYGTPTDPINSTTALAELQQIYVNSSTTQTAANTQLSLSQLIQAMATFAPQQSATAPTVVAAQSNASQQQIAASTGH